MSSSRLPEPDAPAVPGPLVPGPELGPRPAPTAPLVRPIPVLVLAVLALLAVIISVLLLLLLRRPPGLLLPAASSFERDTVADVAAATAGLDLCV